MWYEPSVKHPFYNSACNVVCRTWNATCISTWNVETSTDYWTVWNFKYSEERRTHSSRNIKIFSGLAEKKKFINIWKRFLKQAFNSKVWHDFQLGKKMSKWKRLSNADVRMLVLNPDIGNDISCKSEENIWNMLPGRKWSSEYKWIQEAPRKALENRNFFFKEETRKNNEDLVNFREDSTANHYFWSLKTLVE